MINPVEYDVIVRESYRGQECLIWRHDGHTGDSTVTQHALSDRRLADVLFEIGAFDVGAAWKSDTTLIRIVKL